MIQQVNNGKTIAELIGLSTDTKPTTNVSAGSSFTESDTRRKFKFDGTSWFLDAMEDFGPTVDSRPSASSVPRGFVWMAVVTQQAWQSDGTNWVEV